MKLVTENKTVETRHDEFKNVVITIQDEDPDRRRSIVLRFDKAEAAALVAGIKEHMAQIK